VQFSVPHAGWAFIALAHREVRMLLIGVPAALIALFALLELVGAFRESRRRDLPVVSAGPVATL
jgi:signal peptidase